MKIAIYCRVSTDDKGQDPKVQLEKCRNYCELNNHKVVAELLEEGISGNSWYYDRPKGKELQELIDHSKIEGIICFSLDRFSRQNPMKILPLLKQLKDRGIIFISVTEPIFNLEGDMAQPMQYLLAWFNNYFLKQHITKVQAGLDKAKKYGTKSGKPIGRVRTRDYDQIILEYNKLGTISQVAKKLNISKSSVKNALDKLKMPSSEIGSFEQPQKEQIYRRELS